MKHISAFIAFFMALLMFSTGVLSQELADVAAGRKRAAVCFACHGEDGVSKNPMYPHLSGQQRAYLEKQLRDFRDGRRVDSAMSAMAKSLTDDDIRNIAAYFWGVTLVRR
jgi:cytochrome c553